MNVQTVFAGGVNPWAMYFRPPKVKKNNSKHLRVDLEISRDPILHTKKSRPRKLNYDQIKKKKHSIYAHNYEKMDVGDCIVCRNVSAQCIAESLENWIISNRRRDLTVKVCIDYNKTGIGRVWMVKA